MTAVNGGVDGPIAGAQPAGLGSPLPAGKGERAMQAPPPPASAVAAAFAELTQGFMAGAQGQPGLGGLKRGAEDDGGAQGRSVRSRGATGVRLHSKGGCIGYTDILIIAEGKSRRRKGMCRLAV